MLFIDEGKVVDPESVSAFRPGDLHPVFPQGKIV
jgi:hypothetical protein